MPPNDAEAMNRLRAILRSSEFQPSWSEQFWDWLDDIWYTYHVWLQALSPAARTLLLVICILLLLTIAIHIWKIYRDVVTPAFRPPQNKILPEKPRFSIELLIEQARLAADDNRLRDAARALQQALLLRECRDRGVAWRPTLSDWEWISILHPSARVIDLTCCTQRLAFGPAPKRADFDTCMLRFQELHQARTTADGTVAT